MATGIDNANGAKQEVLYPRIETLCYAWPVLMCSHSKIGHIRFSFSLVKTTTTKTQKQKRS